MFRILKGNPKKELLRGLWVNSTQLEKVARSAINPASVSGESRTLSKTPRRSRKVARAKVSNSEPRP